MKRRSRRIAIAAGAVVILWVGYLIIDGLFLSPMSKLDQLEAKYREEILEYRREVNVGRAARAFLRQTAADGFGSDVDRVGATVHAHLESLMLATGLTKENIRLQGGGMRKGYREVSARLKATGTLPRIVDFLFLLREQPMQHQVSEITLSRVPESPRYELSLRYSTILVTNESGKPLDVPLNQPPTARTASIESPKRELYAVIARRRPMIPYVKKPPVQQVVHRPKPKPKPVPQRRPQPQPKPRFDPLSRMKLVDLTSWGDKQDIGVQTNGQTKLYEIGDDLAGGTIVAVDFRFMPYPDKPEIDSPSRIILEIEGQYWAVELGHTLAQKHRLKPEQLPEELRKETQTTTQPAETQAATAVARDSPGGDESTK